MMRQRKYAIHSDHYLLQYNVPKRIEGPLPLTRLCGCTEDSNCFEAHVEAQCHPDEKEHWLKREHNVMLPSSLAFTTYSGNTHCVVRRKRKDTCWICVYLLLRDETETLGRGRRDALINLVYVADFCGFHGPAVPITPRCD